MWCYRRMLRISYKDHITNETVLLHMGTSRQMVNIYRCRKLRYFGHVVREGGILSLLCLGKIAGRRARGRQRQSWLDEVKLLSSSSNLSDLMTRCRDRAVWRSIVSNSQSWEGNLD